MDSFKIAEISAIAMIKAKPPSEDDINLKETLGVNNIFGSSQPTAQFQMIYQNFYCVFTVESQELAEKWVNSIKMVQDELKETIETHGDEDDESFDA